MGPFPAGLCCPLAAGMAQKILWVCLHVYPSSAIELAPHHAQTLSKFKSPASWLGNEDLDSAAAAAAF